MVFLSITTFVAHHIANGFLIRSIRRAAALISFAESHRRHVTSHGFLQSKINFQILYDHENSCRKARELSSDASVVGCRLAWPSNNNKKSASYVDTRRVPSERF